MLPTALATDLKKLSAARALPGIAALAIAAWLSTGASGAESVVRLVDVAAKAGVTLVNI